MSGLASVFPPPPPYYKRFTSENRAEADALLAEGRALPETLAELAPPPPPGPDQKSYRGYGSIWNVQDQLPPLKESGIEQLFADGVESSTASLVAELRRLLRSVLVSFLGLVQTLSSNPVQFPERVESLRTLFVNMHHLLNIYRPLQTKESLALMLEDQIAVARANAAKMRASNEQIGARIRALAQRLPSLDLSADDMSLQDSEWDAHDLDVNVKRGGSGDAARDEDAIMD